MKPESLALIKKEIKEKSVEDLQNLCLRLAKYKLENKELLSFLLFYDHDRETYVTKIKEDLDEQFLLINATNLYWAKKTIRKILRMVNKHIKYVADKSVEIELLMYFCEQMKESGIPFWKSTALFNLYERQIIKIEKAIGTLHEDLQYDWKNELASKSLGIDYFK